MDPHWYFCSKCQGLFFQTMMIGAELPDNGTCPADGGFHDPSDSTVYDVHILTPGKKPHPGEQDEWRRCRKCHGLFYGGLGVGVCSAGDGHNADGVNFALDFGDGNYAAQPLWRHCGKCGGLWYSGNSTRGHCPRDNLDHEESGHYELGGHYQVHLYRPFAHL